MQYNSHATSQDVVSEALSLSKASLGTYPIADITRRANAGVSRYFEIAFEVTGDASIDDANYGAVNIGTQTLTSGTNSYLLSSFTGTALNVVKLEVLDSNSNSTVLSEERLEDVNFGKDYSTSIVGVPTNFVRLGNYFYVRPTPNYTKAAGLVAYINRKGSYFTTTDTTKTTPAGMPELYLPRYIAQPYLEKESMANAQSNYQHILEDEQLIRQYFLRISKNSRARMQPQWQDNR